MPHVQPKVDTFGTLGEICHDLVIISVEKVWRESVAGAVTISAKVLKSSDPTAPRHNGLHRLRVEGGTGCIVGTAPKFALYA